MHARASHAGSGWLEAAALMPWCLVGTYLLQDGVGHGGVGVHDDGGCFVVPDLFQQRGRVPAVVQHSDRERVLGDEELAKQLLEV